MNGLVNRKILIVDDEPNILSSYERGLRRNFQVETALSGSAALELAETVGPFAAVVADMRMPGMDGAELLRQMQERCPDTVRIMLTGNVDQATAVAAVNKGRVFQFLNKPCSLHELVRVLDSAVVHYAGVLSTHAELAQNRLALQGLSDQLEYQKSHDLITGLENRHALEMRLAALMGDPRHIGVTAILHLDLDYFHLINDAFGHVAGDFLLREMARLLTTCRRDADFLARLASDEFLLVLTGVNQSIAETVSLRLMDSIRSFRFHWEAKSFDITTSAGLIFVDHPAGMLPHELLSKAQTACQVAKEQGRNRLHIGGEGDTELTQRISQSQFVARIKQAFDDDCFRLYFQPIVPVGRQLEGLHGEILVRMVDSEGALVPPGEFLPLVEQYHLAPRMDCWVIEHTAQWLMQHPDIHRRLKLTSLNLSGLSLGDATVFDHIIRHFADTGLEPERICLEVTETAAVSRLNLALDFIGRLQTRGFRFALDDFGSGMSSFGYLRNLPVDYLKIDGAFVKDMDVDDVDHAMVKSISEIGRVMGKRMVAEYVENARILELLERIGVDYAQGYYIARPHPLDDLLG